MMFSRGRKYTTVNPFPAKVETLRPIDGGRIDESPRLERATAYPLFVRVRKGSRT